MPQPKIIIVGVIAGLALGGFVYTLDRSALYAPEIEVPMVASVGSTQFPLVTPNLVGDRLAIPTLGIDAKVQNVGITRKGTMSVPNNFTDVGWYKYGSVPGQAGTAVFAGHVDNGIAMPGVFKHLGDVQIGDEIFVNKKDGTKLRFIVTQTKTYAYDATTEDIFKKDGLPELKLITCTGVWVQKIRTHDKRLVVTAVLDTAMPTGQE